jgi:hypothetical protein
LKSLTDCSMSSGVLSGILRVRHLVIRWRNRSQLVCRLLRWGGLIGDSG